MNKRVYLSPPDLSDSELIVKSLEKIVESGWVGANGHSLTEFEELLRAYTSSNQVLCLNSGTSSLHIALKLVGVKKGDIVVCPTFTYVATVNAIKYLEAEAVFVDCELDTWAINSEDLFQAIETLIKKNKKPKAIVIVDNYGMPFKVEKIQEITNHYDIPLIEDAAAALGSKYKHRSCGTLADLGVFSFNENKLITTGSGGGLILKTLEQYQKALYWATQAKTEAPFYLHHQVGYNYRMSALGASLGMVQLRSIDTLLSKRKTHHQFYKDLTQDFPLEIQTNPNGDFDSNFWLNCLVLTNRKYQIEALIKRFNHQNIETRRLWYPMHNQPVFKHHDYFGQNNSDYLFNNGLCMPSGSSLNDDTKERIKAVLVQFFS